MSERQQRDETDAAGEREETIRDLDVPEDEAGRLRGGQDRHFSKVELFEPVKTQ